jgi:hypothetical protein
LVLSALRPPAQHAQRLLILLAIEESRISGCGALLDGDVGAVGPCTVQGAE